MNNSKATSKNEMVDFLQDTSEDKFCCGIQICLFINEM